MLVYRIKSLLQRLDLAHLLCTNFWYFLRMSCNLFLFRVGGQFGCCWGPWGEEGQEWSHADKGFSSTWCWGSPAWTFKADFVWHNCEWPRLPWDVMMEISSSIWHLVQVAWISCLNCELKLWYCCCDSDHHLPLLLLPPYKSPPMWSTPHSLSETTAFVVRHSGCDPRAPPALIQSFNQSYVSIMSIHNIQARYQDICRLFWEKLVSLLKGDSCSVRCDIVSVQISLDWPPFNQTLGPLSEQKASYQVGGEEKGKP